MYALKRNILLYLQTLANLNNSPIIIIDTIINSLIIYFIIFSCYHSYPLRSFLISSTSFPTFFSYTLRDRERKRNKHFSELF